MVHGRADARWLPSRYRFALFRLYAFVRMKSARPEVRDVSLVLDRDQNNLESFGITTWVTLTVTCYAAGTLFASWPLPLALLAAVPVAITFLEIPIVIVGVTVRWTENNLRLNSVVAMSLLIAAALMLARAQSWVRYVAWQFLALLALNAVAAGIVFLLRGAIDQMESAAGGLASEL